MSSQNVIWYISKEVNGKKYYIQEFNKLRSMTMWTPKVGVALRFESATAALMFKTQYLHNRNDIEVISGT